MSYNVATDFYFRPTSWLFCLGLLIEWPTRHQVCRARRIPAQRWKAWLFRSASSPRWWSRLRLRATASRASLSILRPKSSGARMRPWQTQRRGLGMKSRISSGKKETRARQTLTPACGQCRYSHYYKKTPIFHLYHASVALERYASLKSMHLKMQEVRVFVTTIITGCHTHQQVPFTVHVLNAPRGPKRNGQLLAFAALSNYVLQ